MGIPLPAHCAHDLNRHRRDAVREDREPVLLGLSVEHLEAGHRDNTGLDVVVIGEVLDGVNADADFGTGRNKGDLSALNLVSDVASLDGLLDGRARELRKVLARKRNDTGGVLGGKSNIVSSARLVTVGRPPNHAVGESTEVCQSLNRLVGRAVLTQTNRVVGGNPDHADLRESRETDGTSGVRHEVQEGTSEGKDGTIGSQTVHDGTHTVLTDTVANVATSVVGVTQLQRGGLEVNGTLPPCQVGASKIGRSSNKLGNGSLNLGEDGLRQLTRGDGGV